MEYTLETVTEWDSFLKDTSGKQIVRSVYSISANIAEGYRRYFLSKASSFLFPGFNTGNKIMVVKM